IAGARVPVLDPADAVIHLALHAFREGGGRLQWLKDLEQSAANRRPDWDVVIDRASTWGLSLVVGVMLDRARRTLGAAVPPEVTRRLAPNAWRAVVRTADAIVPISRTDGRGSLGTLVVRSTGDSVARSYLGLVRASVERVLETARRAEETPAPPPPAPGRAGARAAYLAPV